jgi:hypothetical protein
MTQRGRGLLEINPSRSPFFQTTSSDIGSSISDRANMEWDRPVLARNGSNIVVNPTSNQSQTTKPPKDEFSFLYARSSDVIGGKLEKKTNAMAACMDTHPSRQLRPQSEAPPVQPRGEREHVKKDVSAILAVYKHAPRPENPLYTTSSNEYGKKAPSVATYVAEREGRPQDFSKSFNGIKPKNSSLNTSISKSTVHPKLDPQFM